MANLGLVGRAYKELFEDWTGADNIGTAVADGLLWLNSSDGGNTAFAIVADSQGPIVQGATDGTDDDMIELGYHLLTWSAQHGELYMEARVKISVGAVASGSFTVGFNDDVLEDSNAMPVTLSGTTFTSNATTFIGVVYDGAATNADAHAFWVDDDADASVAISALRFVGVAPILDEWFGVAIRLTDAGSGNQVIAEISVAEESTGKYAQRRFSATIDRDALLTPHISMQNSGAVAHTFEIDYVYARQSRSAT